LGIAEVDGYVRSDRKSLVVSEFSSAIPGQRGHQPSRQVLHLPDQGTDNAVSIFARDPDQHDKPGLTLDQGGDVAILSAGEEVAFPVPRNRSVLYLGRTLSDGHGVDDLPTRLSVGG
jgi:hypothetical protein